jgi:sugar/nucleoside kinase (ribokinase family)
MPNRPRVAIVGDSGLDITLSTPAGAAEKVTAEAGHRGLGGTGANAAVAAARLGSEVRLATAIGDDAIGGWVRTALSNAGVTVVSHDDLPGRTEVAVVLLEGSTRRLIVDPGIAYDLAGVVPEHLPGWADVLYLTHVEPELVASLAAAARGLVVVGVEPGDGRPETWQEALATVAVAIANEAGEAFQVQAARGSPAALIVTRGTNGATLYQGARTQHVAAPTVHAVDATGAGDAFAGALCHFLGSGLEIARAVQLAVVGASLSTRAIGAQAALPSAEEVLWASKSD